MEFGLEKCAALAMNKRKIVEQEEIKLPNNNWALKKTTNNFKFWKLTTYHFKENNN